MPGVAIAGRQLRSCSLFFIARRPPPTSTLFPYTTLFRSRTPPQRARATAETKTDASAPPLLLALPIALALDRQPDRKSTRLNSSHPSISYAVLRSKKKSNLFWRAAEHLRAGFTPAVSDTN